MSRPDFESVAQPNSEGEPNVATLVSGVSSSTLIEDAKKAYALNASKCNFVSEEIPFLGCFIGKRGSSGSR